MLLAALLICLSPSVPDRTVYSQVAALQLEVVDFGKARKSAMVEAIVPFRATFDNPFDPADVSLDLEVRPPGNEAYTVPAYFSVPVRRDVATGKDAVSGPGTWKVRWTPMVAGLYRLRLLGKDRAGAVRTDAWTAEVQPSDEPGFVRVSPRDRRFFEYANGTAFYPIGANLCWAGERGLLDYQAWIPAFAASGVNFSRLWLSPAWTTFGLEKTGKPQDGGGLGFYDPVASDRLDAVLALAQANKMQMMLCIESYNILRDRDASNYWEQTPHNRANGGPLDSWSDFWTDPKMLRFVANKQRYLVARYGAFPNVFAWELWNEADLTRDFDKDVALRWHQEVAGKLRQMDPYRHLITTSFSSPIGIKEIDTLDELDFVQSHYYGNGDPAKMVADQQTRKASWGRPHFFGEVGADAAGPRPEDRTGMQFRDPAWISLVTGASGTAMPWWWDSYIAPKNLESVWHPISKFVAGIDWPAEDFRQIRPKPRFALPQKNVVMEDVEFSNGPKSWEAAPQNRPQLVKLSPSGNSATAQPVSGLLHGVFNHPELHNPVGFDVNFPRPVRFEVDVSGVSGYGGAALTIAIDGDTVLAQNFADKDESTETLNKYNKTYAIQIPAGPHRVVVRNPGRDWLMAGYRFRNVRRQTGPPVEIWGSMGNAHGLFWLRQANRTWRNVVELKKAFPKAPATKLDLTGLAAGYWVAEVWDTTSGKVLRRTRHRVRNNGMILVHLPEFAGSIAMKLSLQPARKL